MFKSIQDHNTKMMVIAVIKHGRKRGDSDDVIIDAGNDAGVKGMGMTFDEWYAKYGPGSPDYQ